MKPSPKRLARSLAALPLGLALALTACPLLEELERRGLEPVAVIDDLTPEVEASALQLRHGPTLNELAAYYCPRLSGDPLTRAACSLTLGPAPHRSHMAFEFGITIRVANPNEVPIPALDILLALTLFDAHEAEALGAICLSLCGADDPECDGTPKPGACVSTQDDIRTIDDFIARLPGLIEDIASGKAEEELRKSTIAAGGDIVLDLAFVMGIDQALGVFEKTAWAYVEDLLAGRDASLVVPVSAEGSVFVQVPALGRVGVNYGPLKTTWNIEESL